MLFCSSLNIAKVQHCPDITIVNSQYMVMVIDHLSRLVQKCLESFFVFNFKWQSVTLSNTQARVCIELPEHLSGHDSETN